MLYYLGKGTEFKKEDCKEYKTIEGALKAAAKNEELVVWDENGNVIGSLTNNVPEGALETNPDGSEHLQCRREQGRHDDRRGTQSSNNPHR